MSNQANTTQHVISRIETLSTEAQRLKQTADKLRVVVHNGVVEYELDPLAVPVIFSQEYQDLLRDLQQTASNFDDYYKQQLKRFINRETPPTPHPEADPRDNAAITKEALVDRVQGAVEGMGGQLIPTIDVLPMTSSTEVKDTPTIPVPREEGGLPSIVDPRSKITTPTAMPAPQLSSISKLISDQSPLYDIFAGSPVIPKGRGKITIGSPGWDWHKQTNPIAVADNKRARLPNGFYGGTDRPAYALIRSSTCITIWSLALNEQFENTIEGSVICFLVGLSDADPQNFKWFSPEALTKSFCDRLVNELTKWPELNKS